MIQKYVTIPLSLMLLVTVGCREQLSPETPDWVEYGWDLMAEQSYREAITQFEIGKEEDASYADSWNGLGWAYAKLGIADTSNGRFTTGAALNDSTVVATEILAGRSFARLALGDTNAVADGKAALARTPAWEFARDPSLSYLHLYLTVSTGFYSWGKFDSSLVWVKKLDATFNANTATLAGRAQLADKLQSLADGL